MLCVVKMYTDLQWSFCNLEEVHEFLNQTEEIHHNDAMVVEAHKDGVRAWIGTDFLQRYEEIFSFA